jgi:hypothetical protein
MNKKYKYKLVIKFIYDKNNNNFLYYLFFFFYFILLNKYNILYNKYILN